MKGISIRQPWASLIAVGAKKYETRSWATSYRGPLLICAAKKEEDYRRYPEQFRDRVYASLHKESDGLVPWMVPYGCAVAIADLTACLSTYNYQTDWIWFEATFGDFSPGRFAWKLENVRAIDPFPVKGRQRLFEVEVDMERLVAV